MSKFCNVCGAQLQDNDLVCPRCGNRNFSNLTIRQSKKSYTSTNTNTRNNYDSANANSSTNGKGTFVNQDVNATNIYTPVNTEASTSSSDSGPSSSKWHGLNKKLLIGAAAVVVLGLVVLFSGSSAPTDKDLQEYIAQKNVTKIMDVIDYCHKHKGEKKMVSLKKEAWEALVMMDTSDAKREVQNGLEKGLDRSIIITALVKKDPEYIYKQISEAINKADGCGKNFTRAFEIMAHCDSVYGSYDKKLASKAHVAYVFSKFDQVPNEDKIKVVTLGLAQFGETSNIGKTLRDYKYYYNLFAGGRYKENKEKELNAKIQIHIDNKNRYQKELLNIEKYGDNSIAIVAKTQGFDAAIRQVQHLTERGAEYMNKYFQEEDAIAELQELKSQITSNLVLQDSRKMDALMYKITNYGKNIIREFKTNNVSNNSKVQTSQQHTEQPITQNTPVVNNNKAVHTATIKGNNVDVRKGPGNNYASLGVFFNGDVVRVVGEQRDVTNRLWFRVEYDNPSAGLIKGYVSSKFIILN